MDYGLLKDTIYDYQTQKLLDQSEKSISFEYIKNLFENEFKKINNFYIHRKKRYQGELFGVLEGSKLVHQSSILKDKEVLELLNLYECNFEDFNNLKRSLLDLHKHI